MDQAGEETVQIKVSSAVKRQIQICAAQRGETIRSFILKALREIGISIPERDLVDRRRKPKSTQDTTL